MRKLLFGAVRWTGEEVFAHLPDGHEYLGAPPTFNLANFGGRNHEYLGALAR